MVAARSTVVLAALGLLGRASAQVCRPCNDVHIFLARGNNEPYPGRQGDLVAAVCEGVKGCGYENLEYSALYTDLSCQTTYDGSIAGHVQLTSYAERCPKSKLILAGYSQGAQIVTDILGGGGGESFNGCIQPSTPPLDRGKSPGNRLNAILIYGNTRHTANQPYNFGDGSSFNGLYPKGGAQLADILPYTDIMRDWCYAQDPICAAAKQPNADVKVHLNFYSQHLQEAAAWIRSVASITADSDFHTAIPTQVSGTVDDYATVPPGTPSGTVTTTDVITRAVTCPGETVTTSSSVPTTSTAVPPTSSSATSPSASMSTSTSTTVNTDTTVAPTSSTTAPPVLEASASKSTGVGASPTSSTPPPGNGAGAPAVSGTLLFGLLGLLFF